MSDAIFQQKAQAFAQKNDALRGVFALDGVRCFLLKRDGQSSRYAINGELLSGWRVKFDNNRSESGLLSLATTDIDAIRDRWADSSQIAYGVPTDDNEIEVYAFASSPETGTEKDRIDPDGSSVYFSGRIVRDAKERFTIPDYLFDEDGNYLVDADGFRMYDES